tara:strand:+ start:115 stop:1062 length:948 start_codon:yes stop_codon:yes gene_type:complete
MKNTQKPYIREIKGDASFRKFYRKKENKFSSIIVKAYREKNQNLLIYDSINKILNKNKVFAPRLYNEKYTNNFIEIEDFGDETFYKLLKKKTNKLLYFKRIIEILNKIQSIKDRKIKNFKNKNYTIPKYNRKILIEEANLFCNWYIKKRLKKKDKISFIKRFKKIIKKLSLNLQLKNNVFVHRDFHVSNLMLIKKGIGVIDSQDALIGNKAYDLSSLIDDVRFKTSNSLKKKIYNYYLDTNKKINRKKFKNDFEILSVLRNLKIIGIFTRLAIRDNKRDYLKLIPYAWKLIDLRINQNRIFDDLSILLKQFFRKK